MAAGDVTVTGFLGTNNRLYGTLEAQAKTTCQVGEGHICRLC